MATVREIQPGRRIDLGAGEAVVVPRGVWHQITMREPARLLHVTPGPNGDARLRSAGTHR